MSKTNFQHSELMSKKEKLSNLELKIKNEEKVRMTTLRNTRESLRARRDKNLLLTSNNRSMSQKEQRSDTVDKNNVQQEIKGLDDEDFSFEIPRIVQEKVCMLDTETKDIHHGNQSLKKRILGY